jgi:pimeloyl-ACP methyl ester carboxylesterase
VLLVPHHGAKGSSTAEFIAAVDARDVLFSVGYRNRFGHPRPEIVERYASTAARLWRTDHHGALRVVLNARRRRSVPGASNGPVTGMDGDTFRPGGSVMTFKQQTVQCLSPSGLHRMAYVEWGASDNPRVLICVHGLTRNARDFDVLATALSSHYRVICPDVVGRGQSGRLRDPAGYAVPQYVADMVTLIARLNVDSVHWLGTSMGGLIGMALAAQENSPIHKLILNDVGPLITVDALKRIASYVGSDPTWASADEALVYVKAISAPFGPLSEAQWLHLTETSIAQRPDGRWGFRYDPRIAEPFKAAFVDKDIDLWPVYQAIALSDAGHTRCRIRPAES